MKSMKFDIFTDHKKIVIAVPKNYPATISSYARLAEGDTFDILQGAKIAAVRTIIELGPFLSIGSDYDFVGVLSVPIDEMIRATEAVWFELGYSSADSDWYVSLWRFIPAIGLKAKLVLK